MSNADSKLWQRQKDRIGYKAWRKFCLHRCRLNSQETGITIRLGKD